MLGADYTTMARYGPDGTITAVASWSSAGAAFPVGTRWSIGGQNVSALVFQTARPTRIDDHTGGSASPKPYAEPRPAYPLQIAMSARPPNSHRAQF
jgi:hypothetical protein